MAYPTFELLQGEYFCKENIAPRQSSLPVIRFRADNSSTTLYPHQGGQQHPENHKWFHYFSNHRDAQADIGPPGKAKATRNRMQQRMAIGCLNIPSSRVMILLGVLGDKFPARFTRRLTTSSRPVPLIIMKPYGNFLTIPTSALRHG